MFYGSQNDIFHSTKNQTAVGIQFFLEEEIGYPKFVEFYMLPTLQQSLRGFPT